MAKANKEKQRKAPILRFKGFTDDWEQRQLKDVAKVYDGIHETPQYTTKGIPFVSVENIKDLTTKKYVSEEFYEKKFKVKPEKNDILMTRIGDIGTSNVVSKLPLAYYVSLALIKVSQGQNSYFFKYLFDSDYVQKEFWSRTLHIAFPKKINKNEIGKINIHITNTTEENKIAQLFNKLESLLTLYEQKKRLLGKLRTFLTQRLFANSSKVHLFFDNDTWSKHKTSEFLMERDEKGIPNPDIPLVSFTVEKGVTPKSKRYNREFLVKDSNKKYKITKKDDIVYNPANLKFGAIARNKFGNAVFSPIYVTFTTKLNPVFTEFLVSRKDFINLALKYQEGTVYERMAVKSKDFLNLKIYLPNSLKDIDYIAQILQSLDTLVSLNENKISLVNLIKKELLNNMFI